MYFMFNNHICIRGNSQNVLENLSDPPAQTLFVYWISRPRSLSAVAELADYHLYCEDLNTSLTSDIKIEGKGSKSSNALPDDDEDITAVCNERLREYHPEKYHCSS